MIAILLLRHACKRLGLSTELSADDGACHTQAEAAEMSQTSIHAKASQLLDVRGTYNWAVALRLSQSQSN